jgi:hypothetical protein
MNVQTNKTEIKQVKENSDSDENMSENKKIIINFGKGGRRIF